MSEELDKYRSVGPPGQEIYMTKCRECDGAIGFYRPPAPKLCGFCEKSE